MSVKIDGRKAISSFKNDAGQVVILNKRYKKHYRITYFQGREIADYVSKDEAVVILNNLGLKKLDNTI